MGAGIPSRPHDATDISNQLHHPECYMFPGFKSQNSKPHPCRSTVRLYGSRVECHLHLLQTNQEPTQGASRRTQTQRVSELCSSASYTVSRVSVGDSNECVLPNQIRQLPGLFVCHPSVHDVLGVVDLCDPVFQSFLLHIVQECGVA